ncbi:MAG: fasciclin domain-containing protein [Prevotellaceae bacterium]|nr:fasciclin domain-containing protein [Prevotellaceae bacterium]
MKRYLHFAACAGALGLLCLACQDDRWDEHAQTTEKGVSLTLLDVIRENPDWSSFYRALAATGYDSLLNEANSFTVFVPANSAWEGVKMDDTAALASIVSSHIAYEKKLAADSALRYVQTVNGKMLRYNAQNQSFNGARIALPDNVASNGVAHGVDKIFEVTQNIWEYIRGLRSAYSQVDYINDWNRREMDMARSVRKGVNAQGQPVYDTVWVDVNDFLEAVPLNDEAQEFTYVVLIDNGFYDLYDKYRPYFSRPDDKAAELLTSLHVCRDLAFPGRIDNPAQADFITNIFGVNVRFGGATVSRSVELSNGRVYILSKANVLLRDKIKPVVIEGENFTAAADPQYVFTRYKPLWASEAKDVMLAGSVTQSNRVRRPNQYGVLQWVSISKTFLWSDRYRANTNNFWIEYQADVYSVGYKIYYVAYDDIEEHYSDPEQRMRLEQKLFISFPDRKKLSKGANKVNADAVENNYIGDETCFAGIDTAGVWKETQLRKWSLTLDSKSPQLLNAQSTARGADTMRVSHAGELTLWLCNTARATTASAQGMLFLDYIKLVPELPEE